MLACYGLAEGTHLEDADLIVEEAGGPDGVIRVHGAELVVVHLIDGKKEGEADEGKAEEKKGKGIIEEHHNNEKQGNHGGKNPVGVKSAQIHGGRALGRTKETMHETSKACCRIIPKNMHNRRGEINRKGEGGR